MCCPNYDVVSDLSSDLDHSLGKSPANHSEHTGTRKNPKLSSYFGPACHLVLFVLLAIFTSAFFLRTGNLKHRPHSKLIALTLKSTIELRAMASSSSPLIYCLFNKCRSQRLHCLKSLQSYVQRPPSERELILTDWKMLDCDVGAAASIIKFVVDFIKDEERKTDLLSAWNMFISATCPRTLSPWPRVLARSANGRIVSTSFREPTFRGGAETDLASGLGPRCSGSRAWCDGTTSQIATSATAIAV